MKLLYAIQGTGNGHVSRAREVVPILRRYAQVDVFLSGGNSSVRLPFPVKYFSKGVSMIYDNKGGIDYLKTLSQLNVCRVRREISDLPVEEYDLVINDFEFISARAARKKQVPSIAFSHQAALLSDYTPKPGSMFSPGWMVLKYYAPAPYAVGLHFNRYDDYIFTPVIRNEIRQLEPVEKGHYTVYLPAVGERELLDVLQLLPGVRWQVFSRTTRYPYTEKNVDVFPVQHETFVKSLAGCNGLLTGAGFESPAEALYLKKKLFVIPIRGQYEQYCNAAALGEMGIPAASRFSPAIIPRLEKWINSLHPVNVDYPDITSGIIEQMLSETSLFLTPTLAGE